MQSGPLTDTLASSPSPIGSLWRTRSNFATPRQASTGWAAGTSSGADPRIASKITLVFEVCDQRRKCEKLSRRRMGAGLSRESVQSPTSSPVPVKARLAPTAPRGQARRQISSCPPAWPTALLAHGSLLCIVACRVPGYVPMYLHTYGAHFRYLHVISPYEYLPR